VLEQGVLMGNTVDPTVVDVTLERGFELRGEVVTAVGTPLDGVLVEAMPTAAWLASKESFPGILRAVITRRGGRFVLQHLPTPSVRVELTGPEGTDWAKFERTVTGAGAVRWTLPVVERGGILGRVLDRNTGRHGPSFRVRHRRHGTGWIGYYSLPSREFTSADGVFQLEGLDCTDAIDLLVEAEGYRSLRVEDLAVLPLAEATVTDFQLSKGVPLKGSVDDASRGTPVAGAEVLFGVPQTTTLDWNSWEHSAGILADQQRVVTKSDGSFVFLEDTPGTLFVQAEGYARVRVTPAERGALAELTTPLVLALQRGASIQGRYFFDGDGGTDGASIKRLVLGRIAAEDSLAGILSQVEMGYAQMTDCQTFIFEELSAGSYLLFERSKTPAGTATTRSRRIELGLGEKRHVTFGDDAGTLTFQGRLLDANGSPPIAALGFVLGPRLLGTTLRSSRTSSLPTTVDFTSPGSNPAFTESMSRPWELTASRQPYQSWRSRRTPAGS
jgi:hypothetical protein